MGQNEDSHRQVSGRMILSWYKILLFKQLGILLYSPGHNELWNCYFSRLPINNIVDC